MIQAKLYPISIRQSPPTWDTVYETLADFAVETRLVDRRGDVHLESFHEFVNRDERDAYLEICYKTAEWALEAPFLFRQDFLFTILKQHMQESVTLSRVQIRCLLSLMFWCAFPKQEREHDLPKDYTFYKVLGPSKGRKDQQVAKIICLFNYFLSVVQVSRTENVTFARCQLSAAVTWEMSDVKLSNLMLDTSKGRVEELGVGMIKVDFANSYIGGGVLSRGSVQEECMMMAYVEPIVGVLFIEQLKDKEAVMIYGCRLINKYTGFQTEFRWDGKAEPEVRLDGLGRNDEVISVIDAVNYDGRDLDQYYDHWIWRELNKACIGFTASDVSVQRPIATGNWGCGAFKGDTQLKFLIQWAAASQCGRPMYYLTWESPDLQQATQIHGALTGKKVQDLVRLLLRYRVFHTRMSLFDFILNEMTLSSI